MTLFVYYMQRIEFLYKFIKEHDASNYETDWMTDELRGEIAAALNQENLTPYQAHLLIDKMTAYGM